MLSNGPNKRKGTFITPGKNKSYTGLHAPVKYLSNPEKIYLYPAVFNQTFPALVKSISFPKNYFFSPEKIICALKKLMFPIKKVIIFGEDFLFSGEEMIIDIFGEKIRGRND